MVDIVKYFLGAFCLVIAASKWIQLRRRQIANAAGYYTIACFVLLGAGAVVIAPTTQRFIGAFEPVPLFTRWVGNGLVVAAGFCLFALSAHTTRDPAQAQRRTAWHAAVAVLVLASMGALLLVGNGQLEIAFVGAYGKRPPFAAYLLIFSAYVSCAFAAFIALIRRYSAATLEMPLRVGLYTMLAGAVTGLLWAAWKTVVMIVNLIRPRPVAVEPLVTAVLSSSCTALICIGAVIPVVVRFARDWLRRARIGRYHRDLAPLWRQMHAALPEIKLAPVDGGDDDFSVYRQVIEIRDASLALRPHCHPDVRRWALEAAELRGLTGDQVEIVVEASVLAGALEAHAAGVRYPLDSSTTAAPPIGSGGFDAERDWLARVSRAFARDPMVRHIRRRVREEVSSAEL
ncbi:MAB_1171c family putative transporter [Nocardia ninae]|uniref:DUF6545 domain-containing protein n=1 Tax=Nocardia ninae NBRC 108245 TaxID=1210091 RepID=A0A511MEL6_9NOCA|nr:MAB_1171c family putative transporter [Nocardia ninae]GEM39103.1 hypothetical protein NN4_36220 [Nocardia ninae NBRC 108245]